MSELAAVRFAPGIATRAMTPVGKFLKDTKAIVAAVLLSAFVLCAVIGPAVAPYGENDQDLGRSLQSPSAMHPMGTDQLGRDVLSRAIYGSRVSVVVSLVAVAIAASVGVPLGLLSGYFGGWVEAVIMRFVDAWISFPSIILVLSVIAILGSSLTNVTIAIGISTFPVLARLVRAQTIVQKQLDFTLAARSLGASDLRVLRLHIMPNAIQPVIVQASLLVGTAVLAEASLSFLGLGAQPPAATWGRIIAEGFPVVRLSPWPTVLPGLLILLFVLSTSLIGDRLRDFLDPRLRQSR